MVAKWGKRGKEVIGGSAQAPASKSERISNKLEHTLIAENKIQRGRRLKQIWKRVRSHRRFKPAAIAFVVVVVLASLVVYFFGRKESPAVVDDGPKCTYRMLEAAKPNLSPKNVVKLEKQVREIEAIPGYDTDVNCLYVSLTYYINTSDAGKARELYDKLAAVYDTLEGYETVISDVALPLERLKSEVKFLEEQEDNIEGFVTPPVESFGGGGAQ